MVADFFEQRSGWYQSCNYIHINKHGLTATMILSFIKLIPQSEKRQAMIDILRTMEALTKIKPGCLCCCTYEQADERHAVLYVERWESREALNIHVQSSMYMRLLTAMELAGEAPEIQFYEVEKTMGIELIEALRAGNSG
jgi:quinol monooxygenase YgiN